MTELSWPQTRHSLATVCDYKDDNNLIYFVQLTTDHQYLHGGLVSECQSGPDILLLHGEVHYADLGPQVAPHPVPHPPESQTASHSPVSAQSEPVTLYVLTQSVHVPVYC